MAQSGWTLFSLGLGAADEDATVGEGALFGDRMGGDGRKAKG